jgi:hypothetical protein
MLFIYEDVPIIESTRAGRPQIFFNHKTMNLYTLRTEYVEYVNLFT